ncbi:MAG: ABC transporter permease [Thermodesulfobacteriota bacterium]|tara:strand:- start:22830 stop:24431 length:1602 start_codon:yes stop_codon:yes gene_type:complete
MFNGIKSTIFLSPSILLGILFSIPALIIIFSLFLPFSENWIHLKDTVLNEYISNSWKLLIGVSIGVFIIGVSTAWLTSTCNFFGKNFFVWGLVLPFAIPPYIMAYSFTGLFDSYGTANELMKLIFNLDSDEVFFPSVRNISGAILIFSFTLYPYVFLISRTAFLNQSRDIFDISRTLGLSKSKTFLKVALPLARPAIIAGIMLVAMETLSDFGAVEHFAVPTFTSGIFRTWFGMNDIITAKQLAAFLFLLFLIFIVIEKYSRRKLQYNNISTSNRKLVPVQLYGIKQIGAFITCFIPVLIGFFIPFIQLLYWAVAHKLSYFDSSFFIAAFNTIYLSIIAVLICIITSLVINFFIRLNKNNFLTMINKIISSGYGIPGIVLALGVLEFFSFLDDSFNVLFTGSILGLVFAYSVKFYALPNSNIQSGFNKISSSLDDISDTLGHTKFSLLTKIHLPLLRTSFLTAILVFLIEVIKELPATLILRPFNFDTLSVSAYLYASDDRMVEAAAPSIAIVMVSLIPIILLLKIISRDNNE